MFVSTRRFNRILEYLGVTDYPGIKTTEIYTHHEGAFQDITQDQRDESTRLRNEIRALRNDFNILLAYQGLEFSSQERVVQKKKEK